MKKFLIVAVILIVSFIVYKKFSPLNSGTQVSNPDVILFWGNGCPHCETVKNYIKDKKIDSKLKIDQKEVYYNKGNQQLMEEYANKCQLDTSKGLGVPFAYIDSKCLVGDQPIIDALNQKTGLTK